MRTILLSLCAGLALGGCSLFEPKIPKGLRAELAGSEVVITWDRVLGADNYDLCRRVEGGFATNGECLPVPDGSGLTRTKFSYGDVPPQGSTYFFRVRARNGAGVSPWSTDSAPLPP